MNSLNKLYPQIQHNRAVLSLHAVVFVGQRADEVEGQLKDKDDELLKRDRIITELRLRLPATADRDALFEKVSSQSVSSNVKVGNGHIHSVSDAQLKYSQLNVCCNAVTRCRLSM